MRPRLIAALLIGLAAPPAAAAPKRPNVVVVMADDMGYSDLGCMGGEIATPNLDALAAGGLRFTQFYNTARCCPTRASLLTGLYPHQAGVGHMVEDRHKPGYRGQLNQSCRTMAEVVKPAGYRAYMAGKWHVTPATAPDGPKGNWPLARGFDRFYGTIHGAGSYFDPSSLVRDNGMISPYGDPEYKPETYYYTDAITHHAKRFVGDHANAHAGEPFLLYVAYTAPHWPLHALPEDIAEYRGRYDAGYEPVRRARLEKMVQLGLMPPGQELAPTAEDWSAVRDKPWEARCMEVYAAMVTRMDAGVGELVAELKRTGQYENTLILFLQDNGGCAEPMGRSGNKRHPDMARPTKPTLPPMTPGDFAAAGSVPDRTRDGYPVRMGKRVTPGAADTYIAYGRGWANVSNTPFREYKHWVHEGGIATPLVAHWPAGIAARGELRAQPSHLIDVAATVYDLAGAAYPKAATPLAGTSLAPAFAGKPLSREALYWEHEGNRAVRAGDLKLVAKFKLPWELYDLARDRAELHDLAGVRPADASRLAALWDAWAARSQVEPWPVKQ